MEFITNFSLAKPIEVVKGTSLSSVVGSTSRFLTLQIEKPLHSSQNEEGFPLHIGASTEALYRSTSHHRSNTVPVRHRKPVASTQQTTHLSPTYKRKENIEQQSSSQPFSPSLLSTQPRRRIRVIDDTDDGDSLSSSMANRDD